MANPFRLHHERRNGLRVCMDCLTPMETGEGKRRKRVPMRCTACRAAWEAKRKASGQRAAHKAVRDAVKAGVLARASTQACCDCGRRASVYDHRDYAKPLVVVPVCRPCNYRRGPVDAARAEA